MEWATRSRTDFVALSVSSALVFICLCFLALFHVRRKHQPIASRFWWQSEALGIGFLIVALARSIAVDVVPLPCAVRLFPVVLFLQLILMFTIRVAHILTAFEEAEAFQLDEASWTSPRKASIVNPVGFVIRHAETIQSTKMQSILTTFMLLLHVGIWQLLVLFSGPECTSPPNAIFIVVLCFPIVYGIPLIWVTWKVGNIEDSLALRLEMRLIICVAVIGMVAYIVLRQATPDPLDEELLSCGIPFGVFTVLIILPLLLSYIRDGRERRFIRRGPTKPSAFTETEVDSDGMRETNESIQAKDENPPPRPVRLSTRISNIAARVGGSSRKQREETPIVSFNEILKDREGRKALKKFALLRLAQESILFFEATISFSRRFPRDQEFADITELRETFRGIYYTYVHPSAKRQVNLPHEITQLFVEAGVDAEDDNDFDVEKAQNAMKRARRDVIVLMRHNFYFDFTRSRLYINFMAEKKRKEEEQRRNENEEP